MFKWLGDGLQRWQAIYTAWLYLKTLAVPTGTAGLSMYYVMLEHFHPWVVVLVVVWGFAGGLFLVNEWKKARPPSQAGSRGVTPVRALERYYLALSSLQEHVGHMLTIEAASARFYDVEQAVEKVRRELINLAPGLLPMSAAMEFQKPPAPTTYVDAKVRLPAAIDALMKKVLRQWHFYSEQVGITPLRFGNATIVKLHDD